MRIRADQNGVDWSPCWRVVSAMTAADLYVALNDAWVAAPLSVSDGSAWDVLELVTCHGAARDDAP